MVIKDCPFKSSCICFGCLSVCNNGCVWCVDYLVLNLSKDLDTLVPRSACKYKNKSKNKNFLRVIK